MPVYTPYRLIGLKFYRFMDNSEIPKLVRLIKYDEVKKLYICRNCYDIDEIITIPYDEMHTEWIKLNPDGIMAFSTCTAIDNQGDSVPDVMVRLHKKSENGNIDSTPYVVCRQAVIDIFALLQNNNRYIAGMSVSRDTCPPEIAFSSFYAYDKMPYNINIAYYIDDHMDDILRLFNNKKFNDRLALIKSRDKMGIEGYCTKLSELLKENYFMLEVHNAYGIHELPFASFDFTDDTTNRVVTDYIISNLQEVPTKFYPARYSKYIDLKDIKRKYILICPSSYLYGDGDVVILGYDCSPTISYKDLINRGKSPKEAKKEVMSSLGWS